MNEYDDILNRIVEEFYDTGKIIFNKKNVRLLREQSEPTEDKKKWDDLDYEILKNFWLKYKKLPRHNRLKNNSRGIKVKELFNDYPSDISVSTWLQYKGAKKFNELYLKLLDEFNLYEQNEREKKGGKNYIVTDSKGRDILLRSNGEVIAFNVLKYYGLDQEVEIDSRKFYNFCGEISKEVDFLLPNKKVIIEIAGMRGKGYFDKLEKSKQCIENLGGEEVGWRFEYIMTENKPPKYIHDKIVDILNINNSNYDNNEILNYKSLDKDKVRNHLIDNLIKSENNPYNETLRKRIEKGISIIYGDNMKPRELKNLHKDKIKDFLNGEMKDTEKEFYLIPYLEEISQKYKCNDCGKYKSCRKAKLCVNCSREASRKTKRPTCEELLNPNINKSQIGREYNVSGNAVGKWIIQCQKTKIKDGDGIDNILNRVVEEFFDTGKICHLK
jgi:hypothetical protein